jgi:hypothetical protein
MERVGVDRSESDGSLVPRGALRDAARPSQHSKRCSTVSPIRLRRPDAAATKIAGSEGTAAERQGKGERVRVAELGLEMSVPWPSMPTNSRNGGALQRPPRSRSGLRQDVGR